VRGYGGDPLHAANDESLADSVELTPDAFARSCTQPAEYVNFKQGTLSLRLKALLCRLQYVKSLSGFPLPVDTLMGARIRGGGSTGGGSVGGGSTLTGAKFMGIGMGSTLTGATLMGGRLMGRWRRRWRRRGRWGRRSSRNPRCGSRQTNTGEKASRDNLHGVNNLKIRR
jgi:hypothetical protein